MYKCICMGIPGIINAAEESLKHVVRFKYLNIIIISVMIGLMLSVHVDR
jgi:hypothetical protein